MKIKMPIGIDDFKKLRDRRYYFVDKTFFIRDLIENQSEVTLITRPRRFGKSLNMSMLYYFFVNQNVKENRKIFDGTLISEDAEIMSLQGTRPVIFVTLKNLQFNTWKSMSDSIKTFISSMLTPFTFLLKGDTLNDFEKEMLNNWLWRRGEIHDYAISLEKICIWLERYYGKKVVLLIDEYDVPLQVAWQNGFYEDAIGFIRPFFTSVLKSNSSLDFAVMTGVLRVAKESIFSALNNLEVSSVNRGGFSDAFGFTQDEVNQLAIDLKLTNKLGEIKEWYDGYKFNDCEIYNPWSVINYFKSGCVPLVYWLNTSGNSIIAEMMQHLNHDDEEKLLALLNGGVIETNINEGFIYSEIYENKDALYTMLLSTGYLKVIDKTVGNGEYLCDLTIPNLEVMTVYKKEVINRYRGELQDSTLRVVLRNLINGHAEEFSEGLEKFLLQIVSFHDTANKESFYHGFVLGITAWLIPQYKVVSNRESGYGRFDIAAFPKNKNHAGIILEFKVADSVDDLQKKADEALKQIEDRQYISEFTTQGVERVLKYGVAFCGKNLAFVFRE